MAKRQIIPQKYQLWIEARKRHHLSDAQIQMARELGLNPRKFGKYANEKREPWKMPLPEFIEEIYFKRFGKRQPDVVRSIEQMVQDQREKKAERDEAPFAVLYADCPSRPNTPVNVLVGLEFSKPAMAGRTKRCTTIFRSQAEKSAQERPGYSIFAFAIRVWAALRNLVKPHAPAVGWSSASYGSGVMNGSTIMVH